MLVGNQLRKTAQEYSGPLFALLASVALFGVFYRELLASGFDKIPGDDGDAFLILQILEHWRRSLFLGDVSWLSLSSFFPLANTLGYSDSMFLLGLPYGIVRAVGLDLVTAYQFTLLLVHVIGYVAFYHLLRSVLLLKRLPAILGAALGTLNNAFYASIGHTQLFVMGLAPVAVLLLAAFVRAIHRPVRSRRSRRSRRVAGSGLAILLPLMLYTGYYVTWFLIFFGVLALVVFLLTDRLARAGTAAMAAAYWIGDHKMEMLAYLLLALAALTPFLMTYLPILDEIGGRPFDEVRATLPSWFDFFNVGTANVLWSSLFMQAFPQALTRPLAWELSKGAPPATLLVFLVGVLWGIRGLFSRQSDERTSKPTAIWQPPSSASASSSAGFFCCVSAITLPGDSSTKLCPAGGRFELFFAFSTSCCSASQP